MEAVAEETPPHINKVDADLPSSRKDKRKGVAIPSMSIQANEAGNGGAMGKAHQFVRHQARCSTPIPSAGPKVLVKVGPSLDGLKPHFRPNVLVSARVKSRNKDFRCRILVLQ